MNSDGTFALTAGFFQISGRLYGPAGVDLAGVVQYVPPAGPVAGGFAAGFAATKK